MNALFAKTKTSILGIQNCSLTWQLRASWGHFWEILSMLFSPTLLLKPLYWESKVARTVACKLRTSNIFIEGHRQVISLTAGPRFFFLSLRHTKWFIRNVQEWILKNLPWTNRRNQFVPQKDCPCIFFKVIEIYPADIHRVDILAKWWDSHLCEILLASYWLKLTDFRVFFGKELYILVPWAMGSESMINVSQAREHLSCAITCKGIFSSVLAWLCEPHLY